MTWSLISAEGNASEIKADLEKETQNEREAKVLDVVKDSIDEITEALGGYLSISAGGHINPASGEVGDQIDIRIVSLPEPSGPTPVETTPVAVETPSTPTMTTEEAVAASEGESRPGGTVAPTVGAESPGNSDGTPGLETAPITEVPQPPVTAEETLIHTPLPVETPAAPEQPIEPAPVVEPVQEITPVVETPPTTPIEATPIETPPAETPVQPVGPIPTPVTEVAPVDPASAPEVAQEIPVNTEMTPPVPVPPFPVESAPENPVAIPPTESAPVETEATHTEATPAETPGEAVQETPHPEESVPPAVAPVEEIKPEG